MKPQELWFDVTRHGVEQTARFVESTAS